MKRRYKWLLIAFSIGALVLTSFAAAFTISGWQAFGATPEGQRQARIEQSPQWRDGEFRNIRAIWLDLGSALGRTLFGPDIPAQSPDAPVDTVQPDLAALRMAPASGLRVTWFGHSSTLVEIDGARILTDPLWAERASPVQWLGPQRWFAPLASLESLTPIDAVVISHDHYDHLDMTSIRQLAQSQTTRFIVPLGIGAHLESWGISPNRITELDWWDSTRVGSLKITATPSRHSTGRTSSSSNRVLWAGYAFVGPQHRVWYSGDTGLLPEFSEIGRRLGPFDLTMIETGQYDEAWPDNHMSPKSSVVAHQLVRGKMMLPVRWGLISLAPQGWTEPIERARIAARCADVTLALPRPGQSFEPGGMVPNQAWWPNRPWRRADQAPALATINGDAAKRISLPYHCDEIAALQSRTDMAD